VTVIDHVPAPRGNKTDDHAGEGAAEGASESGTMTSVTKALKLLDAFRRTGPVAGVSDLARATGLPKSTAFRLLNQLAASGFLNRDGTDYRLDQHVFELGNCVEMCTPGDLRSIAAPFLSDLFALSRSVVHLGVLDGTDVLYVDKIQGSSGVKVPTVVGGRVPASCSGLGKAMLPFGHREVVEQILHDGLRRRTRHSIAAPGLFVAELQRVREHGVAFDREEAALGLTCVAAPIIWRGRSIAAISTSGPTGRFDPGMLAARVKAAAHEISALYGAHQHGLERSTH
jgi:DNA-binding IclR family transcriptional regulator